MEFSNIFPLFSFLLIIFSIISRIIYLRSKGIIVASKKSDNFSYKFLIFTVFSFFFLLWIIQLTNIAFQLQLQILPSWIQDMLIHSKFLRISGYIITVASLAFLILSLVHLKKSLRFGLDSNNMGELITSGVFSISRNPFFFSVNLYFTGLAFIFPSMFFIIMVLLSMFSIHFFILKEEKFLRQYYGNEYINYVKKVRRYL